MEAGLIIGYLVGAVVGLFVLYFVIRLAVRHGIRDTIALDYQRPDDGSDTEPRKADPPKA